MKTSQSLKGQAVILEPSLTEDNAIQPLTDSVTALVLRLHSPTQSAPMLIIQDAAGNTLATIDATGTFTGSITGSITTTGPLNANSNAVSVSINSATGVNEGFLGRDGGSGGMIVEAVAGNLVLATGGSAGDVLLYGSGAGKGVKIASAPGNTLASFFGAPVVGQQVGASAAGIASIADANAKAAVGALQAALAALGIVTSPA